MAIESNIRELAAEGRDAIEAKRAVAAVPKEIREAAVIVRVARLAAYQAEEKVWAILARLGVSEGSGTREVADFYAGIEAEALAALSAVEAKA